MKMALNQSLIAYKKNEVPVGCVIVKHGEVISKAYNQTSKNDQTNHAEIIAIKKAFKKIKSKFLDECDLYTTLEPCYMCASAISFARIKRVYFALSDDKFGAISGKSNLFNIEKAYFKAEYYPNIAEFRYAEILKNYFQARRI